MKKACGIGDEEKTVDIVAESTSFALEKDREGARKKVTGELQENNPRPSVFKLAWRKRTEQAGARERESEGGYWLRGCLPPWRGAVLQLRKLKVKRYKKTSKETGVPRAKPLRLKSWSISRGRGDFSYIK